LKSGYGQSEFKGKPVRSHKLAMMVHLKGEIEEGLVVRHKCVNKHCIAIEHLELGTDKQNAEDRKRDGTNREGMKNPNAKLSDDDVKNIIKENGNKTGVELTKLISELAKRYNVDPRTISSIYEGKTWNTITKLPKIKIEKKVIEPTEENLKKAYDEGKKEIEARVNKVLDENKVEHWLWNLSKDKDGYGKTRFMNKDASAHKKSWQCFNGQLVPDGLEVRHKCSKPNCVNPEHLETGTAKQNGQDKVRDGTSGRGSKNPSAKISEDTALLIKTSKGTGITQVQRAKQFNVSYHVVANIDRGSWSYPLKE